MEISNCGGGGIYFVAEMFCIFSPIFFFNRIADSDLFHNIFREMCLKRHMNILSSLCCLVFTNLSLVSISFFFDRLFPFSNAHQINNVDYFGAHGSGLVLWMQRLRYWPSANGVSLLAFVPNWLRRPTVTASLSFHSPVVPLTCRPTSPTHPTKFWTNMFRHVIQRLSEIQVEKGR